MKLRLLDLFSGAGGAAVGYHRAGFEVVGVDIAPQPHYPFEFHQADALEYCAAHGAEFDAIHASPPCQAYSVTRTIWKKDYPMLIEPTRKLLSSIGIPYVIENVMGAAMPYHVVLCGKSFGLKVYRHRRFETSFMIWQPEHLPHDDEGLWENNTISRNGFVGVYGHFANREYAKQAMGIDWMSADELAEAIPPCYTEYIGVYLREFIERTSVKCHEDLE